MKRITRHGHVIGYVILSLGIAVALFVLRHHDKKHFEDDDNRFKEVALAACVTRKSIIQNQELVLKYLRRHSNPLELNPITGHPIALEFSLALAKLENPPNCAKVKQQLGKG